MLIIWFLQLRKMGSISTKYSIFIADFDKCKTPEDKEFILESNDTEKFAERAPLVNFRSDFGSLYHEIDKLSILQQFNIVKKSFGSSKNQVFNINIKSLSFQAI